MNPPKIETKTSLRICSPQDSESYAVLTFLMTILDAKYFYSIMVDRFGGRYRISENANIKWDSGGEDGG